jgi:DNA-binding NtrC family response regulator
MCLVTHTPVRVGDLPSEVRQEKLPEVRTKECERCQAEDGMGLTDVLRCLEVNLLRHALETAGGNKRRAAKLLRTSPSTVRDKLRKYHLDSRRDQNK